MRCAKPAKYIYYCTRVVPGVGPVITARYLRCEEHPLGSANRVEVLPEQKTEQAAMISNPKDGY
jgi:hypothetical protein